MARPKKTTQLPPTGPAAAVVYCRVSTPEQVRGVSLADQERRCRAYCEARGLPVAHVLVEQGESCGGALYDRTEGRRLAELLDGGATAVVAVALDRLFGDEVDTLTTARGWDAKGIALHVLDMGGAAVDTRSPIGQLFFGIMAAVCQFRRAQIAEKVRTSFAHIKARGERGGGQAPYGFDLAADEARHGKLTRLVPNAAEYPWLERIREWRAAGWPFARIAQQLQDGGAPVKGAQPGQVSRWYPGTVARILVREENRAASARRAAREPVTPAEQPETGTSPRSE